MPTVVAHHNITKGADHWLSSPKREEIFGPLGVTNIRTFVDPQDPTHAAIVMDVADMDRLMAAMETPEASGAMDHDGVVPTSLRILVEQ
jgi:hypothetical protein